jgi:endogenous inhibitor of DNA gyrase (YacG/DUF329 family)
MTKPNVAGPACPLCRKPAAETYRPFCSRRCADVDLQRWLSGGYVLPGGVEDDESQPAPPSLAEEE